MGKWIDVLDKLPPHYIEVVVNLSNGEVKKGYKYPNGEWSNGYDVTHWRNVDLIDEVLENLDKLEQKLKK